jgi:hypothetical protein
MKNVMTWLPLDDTKSTKSWTCLNVLEATALASDLIDPKTGEVCV